MPPEGTLAKVKERLITLLMDDRSSATGLRKRFIQWASILFQVGRGIDRNNTFQIASALSFTSIFSLVPVTALFVLYFKVAGKLDAMSGDFRIWVLKSFVAESALDVVTYVEGFVDTLHTKTLGTVGAIGMVVTTYSLIRTIERSFNQIWRVRVMRSFIARFQMLSSILVIVPSLIAASLYLSGKLQEMRLFRESFELSALSELFLVLTPFVLTTFSLFCLFKLVPNMKVRLKPAIVSAIATAALLEAAKAGFNLYVVKVIPYSKIYGALGLVPMLMMWIYVSWIIVLLGVELSHAIQNINQLRDEARADSSSNPLAIPLHEDWGLRLIRAILQHFRSGGGSITLDTVAMKLGLPLSSVQDHIDVLVEEGYLAGTEDGGYLPAKPIEKFIRSDIESAFRKRLGLSALRSVPRSGNSVDDDD